MCKHHETFSVRFYLLNKIYAKFPTPHNFCGENAENLEKYSFEVSFSEKES
jgi:hypothetical protein